MYLTKVSHIRRVGFGSTRFKGFDGVSLETAKWAAVLERMGFECFYYCGQSDRPAERTMVAEEAYFGHPEVAALQARCFGRTSRDEWITGEVHRLRQILTGRQRRENFFVHPKHLIQRYGKIPELSDGQFLPAVARLPFFDFGKDEALFFVDAAKINAFNRPRVDDGRV